MGKEFTYEIKFNMSGSYFRFENPYSRTTSDPISILKNLKRIECVEREIFENGKPIIFKQYFAIIEIKDN